MVQRLVTALVRVLLHLKVCAKTVVVDDDDIRKIQVSVC
jgi:hypothetical protein